MAVFFLACLNPTDAQPQRKLIDSLTWELYSSKKWELLLSETNKSLQKGIDFYYLRVRAGVAAYELKKYRLAVTHFRKAREAYQKDDFLNASFYWALIFSGREDEARGLKDSFQPDLLKTMNVRKNDLLSDISSESLFSFNSDYPQLRDESPDNSGGESKFRSLLKHQFYQGISADMHLSAHLNLYHNFSFMDIRRTFQANNKVNLPGNFKEPFARQFQYFLKGRYFTSGGWDFHTSVSYVWGEYNYLFPSSLISGNLKMSGYDSEIADYVFSAGIDKDMTWFKPGAAVGYAKINGFKQYQGDVSLVIYPFGNLNFYMVPEATLHWDESTGNLEMVYHPQIGIKTGPLWLSGEFGYGRMKNYFSGDGLVVYNMPEVITGKWSFTLWAPLFKNRLDLTLKYLQSAKEGTTFVYSGLSSYTTENYHFTDHGLLISLRWNL